MKPKSLVGLAPGIYYIGDNRFTFFVRVTEQQIIYQLTQDLNDDGVLPDRGWKPGAEITVIAKVEKV